MGTKLGEAFQQSSAKMHAPGKDDNISLLLATFVYASEMHILLSLPNYVRVCCDHLKVFNL